MALLIFLICVTVFRHSFAVGEESGPYNLKAVNITNCGAGGPDKISFDLKTKILNETSNIVDGTINLPKGFGDDMKLTIDVAEWRKEGWVEKVYTFKFKKMCSGLREMMMETFTQITQYLKIEDKCPVAPGSYTLKDFVVTVKTILNKFKYGTYKARLEALQGDVSMGCAETVAIVTPK